MNNCHTWRVTWPTLPPSLKTLRSWFMSHNVSHWLPLKMRMRPLRMRWITWPVSRGSTGQKQLHFWNPRPDLPIHYTTVIGLWRRLRVVYSQASPMLAWGHKFLDPDLWPFVYEQLSCIAGHVNNRATKFEDPMPIRFWFMSYNVSHWLPLTRSSVIAERPHDTSCHLKLC